MRDEKPQKAQQEGTDLIQVHIFPHKTTVRESTATGRWFHGTLDVASFRHCLLASVSPPPKTNDKEVRNATTSRDAETFQFSVNPLLLARPLSLRRKVTVAAIAAEAGNGSPAVAVEDPQSATTTSPGIHPRFSDPQAQHAHSAISCLVRELKGL